MGGSSVPFPWIKSESMKKSSEMATHASVLAWRIPGTAEPGRLLSMGSHRVRHNWSNLAAAFPFPGTTHRDGMGREEGEGSGWGTHVYLWWIHFNIWQNQYNIVKFKNKIKFKKKKVKARRSQVIPLEGMEHVKRTSVTKLWSLPQLLLQLESILSVSYVVSWPIFSRLLMGFVHLNELALHKCL